MKRSSFIKWQITKWLPILAIFLAIGIAMTWISTLTDSMDYSRDFNINYLPDFPDSLTDYFSLFMIPAFLMPFFVYEERFNKTAADTYKAFPAKKLEITRTRIIIALVCIAALITVIYWSDFVIKVISYAFARDDFQYAKYEVHFIWYLPTFFFMIFAVCGTFLFNCTLVGLANKPESSVLYLVAGTFILIAALPCLLNVPLYILDDARESSSDFAIVLGRMAQFGGPVGKSDILNSVFRTLVQKGDVNITAKWYEIFVTISLLVIEIGVGVLAFFIKDNSGEYYGMAGAKDEKHKIILYAAFCLLALFLANLDTFLGAEDLLFIIVFLSTIYVTMIIFNKKFTLNKYELIGLGSSFGCYIVFKTIRMVSYIMYR